jgi:hypothetical protein
MADDITDLREDLRIFAADTAETLADLKARKAERGKRGEDGPPGPQGPPGPRGTVPGPAGKDGAPGAAGKDGKVGPQGPPGRDGKGGAPGLSVAGPAGRDGKDGAPGPMGSAEWPSGGRPGDVLTLDSSGDPSWRRLQRQAGSGPGQVYLGASNSPTPPAVNGLPTGGTAGQVLTKVDSTDYNAVWSNPSVIVAAGKTLTVNNTLTFSGTDGSSVDFGAGGTAAYRSDNLGVFAATTSAQLASVISDETGSGALVFATSPQFVTPLLGAAAADTLSIAGASIGTAKLGITGNAFVAGTLTATNATVQASLAIGTAGVGIFIAGTGSNLVLTPLSGSVVPRLNFGGSTALFSSIKSNAANGLIVRLADDSADAKLQASQFVSSLAAGGLVLKQGANGTVGTFVLNGATPVTVGNTNVAISDAITISLNTVGGTIGVQPNVRTITAATGFTVAGTALDTSTYNYAIIKNAP